MFKKGLYIIQDEENCGLYGPFEINSLEELNNLGSQYGAIDVLYKVDNESTILVERKEFYTIKKPKSKKEKNDQKKS